MTLVRERRHRRALRLSLPSSGIRQLTLQPSPSSSDSHIYNLLNFKKLMVLGHGSGGTVYKVQNLETGSFYALKVLRFYEDAYELRQQAARETEILRRVDSQFVVRCHGVFDDGSNENLCFMMEYMDGGSLHDVLRVCERMPENEIPNMARRVLEGLSYIHSLQIVHGDIKPSNLLMNKLGVLKIADFGSSRVVSAEVEENMYIGTCAYMSPERLDPERWDGELSKGFAGDVWSVGLVLLECYVGRLPVIDLGQKADWATLMCAICFKERIDLPDTMSPEFRSFVERCLEKDWKKRGTVEELLNHPFVTSKIISKVLNT